LVKLIVLGQFVRKAHEVMKFKLNLILLLLTLHDSVNNANVSTPQRVELAVSQIK
jgi:hypothetical protein